MGEIRAPNPQRDGCRWSASPGSAAQLHLVVLQVTGCRPCPLGGCVHPSPLLSAMRSCGFLAA